MAAELAFDVKTFIVQQLACFATPSEVVAAVKEEFDLVLSRQRVHSYDPTTKAGAGLGDDLKLLFERTRGALIDGSVEFGIIHKMVRLRWLNDMAIAAKARGNFVLAAQLIEQAAKEMGGVYARGRGGEGGASPGSKDAQQPGAVFILPDNGRDGFDLSKLSTEEITKIYRDVAAGRTTIVKEPAAAPGSSE